MLDAPDSTVLDLLDHLLNKGVMLNGDVTLGVAGIDLIYLRLSALLCAADRIFGERDWPATARQRRRAPATAPAQATPVKKARKPARARRPRASEETLARRGGVAGDRRGAARASRARSSGACTRRRRPPSASSATAAVGRGAAPLRWNPEPEDVQKSVAQLVLTIVEFLRRLMERQAIRRMEQKTLTRKEVEAVGEALMKLEETVREIGAEVRAHAGGSESRSRPARQVDVGKRLGGEENRRKNLLISPPPTS